MAGPSRESFIPRKTNTPVRSRAKISKRALGVFGYVSYIAFFGAIILAAGVFFISYQVQSTLSDREQALDQTRALFDPDQMDEVFVYERYLAVLNEIFNESFSVAQVFASIENSIVDAALLSSLEMEREIEDGQAPELILQAEVNTDTFDSAMFQRIVYEEFPLLQNLTLNDVVLVEAGQALALPAGLEADVQTASVDNSLIALLAATTGGSGLVTFSLSFEIDQSELEFSPQPFGSTASQPTSQFFNDAPADEVDATDPDSADSTEDSDI